LNPKVLVTVITYNEGAKLRSMLDRFPDSPSYDILVIDDGSTDGSRDILDKTGFTVIRHEGNRGVGAAIRQAVCFGRKRGFYLIVIMAGNGKMLPDEIPRLTEPILTDQADYVQGSRNLEGGDSPNLPLVRKLAIRGFTLFVNLILGKRGTDVTCGFRAYRLDIFDNPIFRLDQDWLDRYEMEYYIHYLVHKEGYRVVEAPVSMIYPPEKKNYSKIRPFTGWWSIIRPWLFLLLRVRR
jgi:dolichol-phosphate mannosyltransferase